MLRFISLGSGSSGNSYFLWTESGGILIDAGLAFRVLKTHLHTLGIKPEQIQAVLITHDHADHIKSVGRLATEFEIPIYATELVHQGIARNYCVSPRVPAERKVYFEKNKPFVIGDFKITPFDVPHDSTDCVGYRIDVGQVRFTLITDIGHITEEVQQEVGVANYLVLESNHDNEMLKAGPYPAYLKSRISGPTGHLSNREAAELLSQYATPSLRHVWFCHLSEENNHPELVRKTADAILRNVGIVPGADFKVDVLKRKVPSEVFELI